MTVGYLTGTFDTFHEAHLEFLKQASELCEFLIVGVTNDEVAARQKRKPLFNFRHRKTVVEGCGVVDLVLEHAGLSKQEDHRRLGFDLVISSTEYVDSEEFRGFTACKVVFLPRGTSNSSTSILETIHRTSLQKMSVMKVNVGGGLLYRLGNLVIKEIHVRKQQIGTTSDVHNLTLTCPRNWKRVGEIHKKRDIPGVNPNRELKVHSLLAPGLSWNPVVEVRQKFSEADLEVHWIVQNYAGVPVSETWAERTASQKNQIMEQVRVICETLKISGIVHGDIHLDNLCIDGKGLLSLVDYGWCTHAQFQMSEKERLQHQQRLEQGFDFQHFLEAVEWFDHEGQRV